MTTRPLIERDLSSVTSKPTKPNQPKPPSQPKKPSQPKPPSQPKQSSPAKPPSQPKRSSQPKPPKQPPAQTPPTFIPPPTAHDAHAPQMTQTPPDFRSGFVALIGQPNVGKSTLLNRALGTHLSIVTPRPQTTRNRVRGILTREERAQLVFVDTPGIHDWQEKALNRAMTEMALGALSDADVVIHIVDVRHVLDDQGALVEAEQKIIEQLGSARGVVLLALNKVDTLPSPEGVLPVIDALRTRFAYKALVPMSAKKGEQVEVLLGEVEKALPLGPLLYPPDQLTDQAEKFFVGELIREQVMKLTEREVPYSVAVEVEQFLEKPGQDLIHIEAVIHVERDSQKGILIGKRGQKLREIGQRARQAMEKFLGKRVFLKTFVRVQPEWAEDKRSLQRFGYDPQRQQP